MKKFHASLIGGTCALGLTVLLGIAACSSGITTAQAGQLFCAVQTNGGGALVVGLIDAAASGTAAGPVAVVATGLAKSVVDGYCAQAGGIAVSPPAAPAAAPQVAVKTAP
jgi:hypothetical protein